LPAKDAHDELAELVQAMAGITVELLRVESEPPPDRSDTMGRLNYVMDALVRYREGVSELHDMLNQAFDRLLEA
jgi:hypothetical protein